MSNTTTTIEMPVGFDVRPAAGTRLLRRDREGRLRMAYAGRPGHDSPCGSWVWTETTVGGVWTLLRDLYHYDPTWEGRFVPAR